MASTASVNLPNGPGLLGTSVFNDVGSIEYDFNRKVLKVVSNSPSQISFYDYSTAATVTVTITGGDTATVVAD